jgi:hypothetical protein
MSLRRIQSYDRDLLGGYLAAFAAAALRNVTH